MARLHSTASASAAREAKRNAQLVRFRQMVGEGLTRDQIIGRMDISDDTYRQLNRRMRGGA